MWEEKANANLVADSGLLSADQVLEISSFLMDLLSQTKHRGAFEQAYVAFTKESVHAIILFKGGRKEGMR